MNCVGHLYRVIIDLQVYWTGDEPSRRRQFSFCGVIPKGTIFLVTKHCKPMADYSWNFEELLADKNMEPMGDFVALSYCTELLVGDRLYYIRDEYWPKALEVCDRLDLELPPE